MTAPTAGAPQVLVRSCGRAESTGPAAERWNSSTAVVVDVFAQPDATREDVLRVAAVAVDRALAARST